MNRKMIIAMSVATIMLTACGTNAEITDTEATTTEASVEVTAEVTEAETEETTEAVQEETEAEAEVADSVVHEGNYYSISVDSSKWLDSTALKELAAEAAEDIDTGLDLTADDYNEMVNVIYFYVGQDNVNANINIVETDHGVDVDMDAEAIGPSMAESFGMVEGYNCTSWEGVTVNGENCLKLNVEAELSGYKFDMIQYMFLKSGKQVAVTLTVAEGQLDMVSDDFNEMLDSIVIK